MAADIIVANADLPYVYENLLPDDGSARKLATSKYTSSALMFYWGVKGERSPELLHHNVFLADHRYRESFERIFNDLTLPDEPSFYVNAPTRTDRTSRPWMATQWRSSRLDIDEPNRGLERPRNALSVVIRLDCI
jgi:phytoene dehydrogenase-like protein